jgi:prepilin peptidase CpaA
MELIGTILLLSILMAAIISDVRCGKISNKLTVPAMVLGVGLSVFSGPRALLDSALGLAAGLALAMILMTAFQVGGGDGKLLMVVGAIKGANFLIWSFLFGAVAGGVLAIVVVARKRALVRALSEVGYGVAQSAILRMPVPSMGAGLGKVPYSLAIAAGCVIALII